MRGKSCQCFAFCRSSVGLKKVAGQKCSHSGLNVVLHLKIVWNLLQCEISKSNISDQSSVREIGRSGWDSQTTMCY